MPLASCMETSRGSLEAEPELVGPDGSWSGAGCLAGGRNGWREECSWDCWESCSLDLESTGVMSEAPAAISTSIEVGFEAVSGEDTSGAPEETDGEGAGIGAPPSSAIDSSESDVRSTVEGILDCLDESRARKENKDRLAREAMRSI